MQIQDQLNNVVMLNFNLKDIKSVLAKFYPALVVHLGCMISVHQLLLQHLDARSEIKVCSHAISAR